MDLTHGGSPSGIETILAHRAMSAFYRVEGFENLREVDRFDLVQAGWTHQFSGFSALELRYGYSTAQFDTAAMNAANTPAQIDLF